MSLCEHPQRTGTSRQNSRNIPEGTNFWTTTWKTPPHPAVSGSIFSQKPYGREEKSCLQNSCLHLGTEKVPQRNCVTRILLVRSASKPLFYWVMTGNPLDLFRNFFGAVRAMFWPCEAFLGPHSRGCGHLGSTQT